MSAPATRPRRNLFAPEVVQSSAMDCGPATLKCLLEGHGIPISYGRLREACQTDVDGTSIDTMEEIAGQLGLEAEQTVLPVDHVLLDEARALPAIVVVRQPNGLTHFIVAWRRHGSFVQLMDPATGRRWSSARTFLKELYVHEVQFPAVAWRDWAEGNEFLGALRRRLARLGVQGAQVSRVIEAGLADASWRTLGTLDAATRMVCTLVASGGLRRGGEAFRAMEAFFQRALTEAPDAAPSIPRPYWFVRPAPQAQDGTEQVTIRGAVLVRVMGRAAKHGVPVSAGSMSEQSNCSESSDISPAKAGTPCAPLSPELVAALTEPPTRPARELLRLIRADGLLAPVAFLGALVLAAAAVTFEAVLFRGLFDLGRDLTVSGQRLVAALAIVGFAAVMLLLELPLAGMTLRLGRRLEIRLRTAFLEKIPRLVDRYFQSRLMSDMAERSHAVQTLRVLPEVGARFLRFTFELLFTAAGIVWLDPRLAPIVAMAAAVAVGLPLLTNPALTERDLRLRTHVGALGRFYLDALLGLVPIRAHGAERAVRTEHESLLVEWARSGFGLQRTAVLVEGAQALAGVGFAVWLLFGYLARTADAGGVLLLVYWGLNLPYLAQEIALCVRQYPPLRSVTLRLLEPLGAPEEPGNGRCQEAHSPKVEIGNPKSETHSSLLTSAATGGRTAASISLRAVTVLAAGHTILEDVSLDIPAGAHLAIVGPSGAGKSSLVGLLLGWHRPASGVVLVDGQLLDPSHLDTLRRQTAWVDPAVHLWNRSLLGNLCYGNNGEASPAIGWVVPQADLLRVLQKLPDGLQTCLGESGGLVSGGEGQRVRFARGLLRQNVRLVILDEPFRGLDREQRRVLLERARAHWRGVTLLCITHDVGETLPFDRVLVVENGRLAEDGPAAELACQPGSRYSALLAAEKQVREELWSGQIWRRHWLERGRLEERA